MNRKNRLIVGGLIALVLIGYLIWSSFATASQKNVPVEELVKNPEKYVGQQIRVQGKVKPGTIEKDGSIIRFEVMEKSESYPVVYKGGIPNSFQDNAEVIIDGEISKSGEPLSAKTLIVKCPSKYTTGENGSEKK